MSYKIDSYICIYCNIPLISSRCFIRQLVSCAFRPRGMLVISRLGYLRRLDPKSFILKLSFSLLRYRTEICSLSLSLSHSLEAQLFSSPSNQSSQLDTRQCCMLEALDEHVECKPIPFFLLASHPCRKIQPYCQCLCVCMLFMNIQVSSLASKLSLGCVDSCENWLDRNLLKPRVNAMILL